MICKWKGHRCVIPAEKSVDMHIVQKIRDQFFLPSDYFIFRKPGHHMRCNYIKMFIEIFYMKFFVSVIKNWLFNKENPLMFRKTGQKMIGPLKNKQDQFLWGMSMKLLQYFLSCKYNCYFNASNFLIRINTYIYSFEINCRKSSSPFNKNYSSGFCQLLL